jgi:penicillin-binding protein 1B
MPPRKRPTSPAEFADEALSTPDTPPLNPPKRPRKAASIDPLPPDPPRIKAVRKTGASKKAPRGGRSSGGGGTLGGELARLAFGGALGALGVGWVLWQHAKIDVRGFLAETPAAGPVVVWSAPMEVHTGDGADPAEFAEDLLAAGYERVVSVEAAGQFTETAGRFTVWTAAEKHPVYELRGGKSEITIRDGKVTSTSPRAGVSLRPTRLATVGDLETSRTRVHLDQVAPIAVDAVLAMEDARFREHPGVDAWGVARAIANNLAGREMQGASTLTQQLAKNLFVGPERTLKRKIREAMIAGAIETELSKDEILEMYLSEVYLGHLDGVPVRGVEEAARAWFGKSAKHLDTLEAATIAGVISSPNNYNPLRNPEAALERRNLAIERLAAVGRVPKAEVASLQARPLHLAGTLAGRERRAPWVMDAALEIATEKLGRPLEQSGYAIHTTVQPLMQHAAERAVRDGLAALRKKEKKAADAQSALVAVGARDGAVLALVGGEDYATSQFNRALHAWRQAGSTVKPLTALFALEADRELTLATPFEDAPIERTIDGKQWTPRNFDNTYQGTVTLRHVLEASRNVPAVLLAERVGASVLHDRLIEVGLTKATARPSAALGAFETTPWEMAGAYTVFPSGGTRSEPWLVSAVLDADGHPVGSFDADSTPIASARAAALATAALEGVVTRGTAKSLRDRGLTGHLAGKTGTTDGFRDAWFVGFDPDVVTAVWVGRDRDVLGLSGSQAAIPVWARFAASRPAANAPFPRPPGIEAVTVCATNGCPPTPACPQTREELFATGTAPTCVGDDQGMVEVLLSALTASEEAPEAPRGDGPDPDAPAQEPPPAVAPTEPDGAPD